MHFVFDIKKKNKLKYVSKPNIFSEANLKKISIIE